MIIPPDGRLRPSYDRRPPQSDVRRLHFEDKQHPSFVDRRVLDDRRYPDYEHRPPSEEVHTGNAPSQDRPQEAFLREREAYWSGSGYEDSRASAFFCPSSQRGSLTLMERIEVDEPMAEPVDDADAESEGDSSDDSDLSVMKIVSDDPWAAARAAAILKQVCSDCHARIPF